MLTHPLVSIIVPLADSLDGPSRMHCAQAQSWPACEVIPVYTHKQDDHSTLYLPENVVAKACNVALKRATGKFIAFLLPGVLWDVDAVKMQMEYLAWAELEDVGVYTNVRIHEDNGNAIEIPVPLTSPECLFRHIYMGEGPHPSGVLFPRSILRPLNESAPECAFVELLMDMAREYTFLGLAKAPVCISSLPAPRDNAAWADMYLRFFPLLLDSYGRENASHLLAEAIAARKREGLHATSGALAKKAGEQGIYAPRLNARYWPAWIKKPLKQIYQSFFLPVKARICGHSLNFSYIYQNNGFGSQESLSGQGSTFLQTRILRRDLATFLHSVGICSMLDLPCGDFHWMRHVELGKINYTGGDVVAALAERNQQAYGNAMRSFLQVNLVRGPLPEADLVFCRDCLVHLPYSDIFSALTTVKNSSASWFLTTTYPERTNQDLDAQGWRVLNLQAAPFHLPPPRKIFLEKCTESGGLYTDKSLGLWHRDDLPKY